MINMQDIMIRKANIEDLEYIQKLNNELFDLELNNYDDTLIKDWPLSSNGKKYFEDLINNQYVIVATINNQIIGYLAGSINDKCTYENIQYGEINNMYIMSNYRGNKIGKRLIDEFKKYCKENNINNIIVTASYKNKSAINFYKNNGFEEFNLTLNSKI